MRVLVDTSVWIDHLHRSDPNLVALLKSTQVVMHLSGRGLGWTDVHLLGSALVSQARLWTRDHPLRHAASQLRISLVT